MAESDAPGVYTIEWAKKPLGFSIVMDTTGKNAYVSSIQKQENKNKGLKLAAQIITINGEPVKNLDHKVILNKIKAAKLPIKLQFQPRSFANEPQNSEIPTPIKFDGAKVNQNRINGYFELTKEKYMGKHQWQRNDEEEDPIILWYWPQKNADNKSKNTTGKDLWMISRKTQRNTESAYACVNSSAELPTDISAQWECFDKNEGEFVKCDINIVQEKQ